MEIKDSSKGGGWCGDSIEYHEHENDEECEQQGGRQQLGQQCNEDKIGECGKERKG